MKKYFLFTLTAILLSNNGFAQKKQSNSAAQNTVDTLLFNKLRYRCIGPFRGGRSLAVTGVNDKPNTYYFGATGGGIWKTEDGGNSWISISDSAFHSSSVGAIAVAPSNSNIIYAGMGEAEMRGNISFGDGVYKSSDAGKTWKHVGLEKSYAISTIIFHPQNPDVVYICAMGNVYAPNAERGLYRSKDGGLNWERVLYKNDSTGCISVSFDLQNPNTIYASLWQAYRNNYSLSSGGKGCGLYKSTDGGTTWKDISKNAGLPVGLLGKITVSVSPCQNKRVWAMVENENGGLFKSDDDGEHWTRTTDNRELRKRPWYFSTIVPDPVNANTIYVLNVDWFKSTDGGVVFTKMRSMHGDHHDLWIDPKNPQRMILGDDGSATVSTDGGLNWTELDIPTAQFYHVNLDNDFPYHVYGAQQDNSSIRISSASDGMGIGKDEWFPVAGGEAGYIVPDPNNSDITYGGEYDGVFTCYNKKNDQNRTISVYPESWFGCGAESKQFRFNWTFPIAISPHDNKTIYVGSQFVHRTTNGGASWGVISPDLTRHEPYTLKQSGGPITKDNTGAEVYADVFAIAESPVKKGVIWAGSDDGYLNVTQDDGKNWNRVMPAGLPEFAMISIIEPSHFDAATCYVAATRHKLNDRTPYLFKTTDYGKTWKKITSGITNGDYTRVVREDPSHKGLLFAGTETGIYISFDDGDHWQSFKQNLPVTPVHDIQIQNRDHDLVLATHGRSFWIMDDITPLYHLQDAMNSEKGFLFPPRKTVKAHNGSYYNPQMQEGENAPGGLLLRYYLKHKPDSECTMSFFNAAGDTIITYSNLKDNKNEPIKISKEFYQDVKMVRPGTLPVDSGMNSFVWDLRYPDAKAIKVGNKALISGSIVGPKVPPGNYTAKLALNGKVISSQNFEVVKDPRINFSDTSLQKQFLLAQKVTHKLSQTNEAINSLRTITKRINDISGNMKDSAMVKKFRTVSDPLIDSLKKVEEELTQPKAVTDYDLFNFPSKLDDKLAGLKDAVLSGDAEPTAQMYLVYDDLEKRVNVQIEKMKTLTTTLLPPVNKMIEDEKLYIVKE
jgi:photosystem II stability/assembly factor-like uncharacterized protein